MFPRCCIRSMTEDSGHRRHHRACNDAAVPAFDRPGRQQRGHDAPINPQMRVRWRGHMEGNAIADDTVELVLDLPQPAATSSRNAPAAKGDPA